ncbi:MAG: PAS domain S-box protein [Planctomycetota bacterium]|nr:MAG: PAS domain S-box protein [Planctomycetota bacterium]
MPAKKRKSSPQPATDAQASPPKLAQAVAALQERESRLTAILEAAADAIITIDKHGIIDSVNPAAERMFGYSAGELIGRNVSILMPAPYAAEHDAYLANYLKTGVKKIIGIGREVTAQRKDGTIFPVDLAVSEVDHLQIYTGILRDLTERKRLEREVVEIALLEQQRLGADLHDQCGQELTALGLLARSLAQSLEKNSPADVPIAAKIAEGLKRELQFVRNVARGLSQARIDPDDLPGALNELAARLAEMSTIRCDFRASGNVRVRDNIAATHLYHIAQEACTNALRHARARRVRVRLTSRGANVRLQVSDDGVGIADRAGEGLGLRVMRNRSQLIGADLVVERGKRGGTIVTCILPGEPRHGPR